MPDAPVTIHTVDTSELPGMYLCFWSSSESTNSENML
jgi:hypothetical protein